MGCCRLRLRLSKAKDRNRWRALVSFQFISFIQHSIDPIRSTFSCGYRNCLNCEFGIVPTGSMKLLRNYRVA
jgi:hypothetical protein